MTTENDRKDSARPVKTRKLAAQEIHKDQATPGADVTDESASKKKRKEPPPGLQMGTMLPLSQVGRRLGYSRHVIACWLEAKMPVHDMNGGQPIVFIDELAEWIKSKPQLGQTYTQKWREKRAKRSQKE